MTTESSLYRALLFQTYDHPFDILMYEGGFGFRGVPFNTSAALFCEIYILVQYPFKPQCLHAPSFGICACVSNVERIFRNAAIYSISQTSAAS